MKKNTQEKNFQIEVKKFNSRAEKFKLIFNTSPDMVFILSHNGLILDANKSALDGYGYEHNQVFGMSFDHLLTKQEDIKKARKLFESVKSGSEIDYEWSTKAKNGKIIPVDVRLRSLSLSDDDKHSSVVLFLRDITDKQKAEEAIHSLARATNILEFESFLKESVRSLAKLYQTKFAFIGRLQPDGKSVTTLAVWAGDRIVDNFTYDLEGTPCKDVLDLKVTLVPSNASERYCDDEMLIQMGIQSYFGHPMVAEGKMMGLISVMDDKSLEVEDWSAPILGLFANRLGVEIDRYEVTQALQKSKNDLEVQVEERTKELATANDELEAFNSSIAHDLRTPIHAISSYCQILRSEYVDSLDDEAKEHLKFIQSTAKDMTKLIEDLLNLSLASKKEIEKEEINVSVIALEISQRLAYINKQHHVELEIDEDVNVIADRGSMISLIDNLLNNAWKYSSQQKIARIKFGKYQSESEEGFYVEDNGAGFDMKNKEKLFEVFKRLHTYEEFPGSGVGLATVARLVDKHGGRIWAEGEVNKGATFFVSLPIK